MFDRSFLYENTEFINKRLERPNVAKLKPEKKSFTFFSIDIDHYSEVPYCSF